MDIHENKTDEARSVKADIRIVYDADDENNRDRGIRSPDNLTWADDGMIYIQEDRATQLNDFSSNGTEASIWQLDPTTLIARRIAIINRKVILPTDAVDRKTGETGTWESTGILDVS
ncbi:MAG: hypothetical protein U9N50_00140, partial [Pseudomonadota bacterium]|nr:hypothetical protein [Pseudomonadota bacterium]